MNILKPFLTLDEQILLLKERGLTINDEKFAVQQLRHINYYRLSGYSLTLRKYDQYYKGITFENIIEIYRFDSKLRAMLLNILEYVEVRFRCHIAYEHSRKFGPMGYI